ncbi:hypothetical protein [Shewanella sp.]|uniref:hypothetical protein n=1 Tax=Shewanella sp. TaxID=50422 RepID=UPI0040542BE0
MLSDAIIELFVSLIKNKYPYKLATWDTHGEYKHFKEEFFIALTAHEQVLLFEKTYEKIVSPEEVRMLLNISYDWSVPYYKKYLSTFIVETDVVKKKAFFDCVYQKSLHLKSLNVDVSFPNEIKQFLNEGCKFYAINNVTI